MFAARRLLTSSVGAAAGRCLSTTTACAASSAFVLGSGGALGKAVASKFVAQGWNTVTCDVNAPEAGSAAIMDASKPLTEQAAEANKASFVGLQADDPWAKQVAALEKFIGTHKFDAVVCCAGGWAGGSLDSKEFVPNMELLMKLNVNSALTAARIGAKYLKDDGFVVLTGAAAALEGTPGMAAYGVSKAATHHLVLSLGAGGTDAVAVMPITIDTPMNRKFMADADFTTWTPPEHIADQVFKWSCGEEARPSPGSLMKIDTSDGNTTFTAA